MLHEKSFIASLFRPLQRVVQKSFTNSFAANMGLCIGRFDLRSSGFLKKKPLFTLRRLANDKTGSGIAVLIVN